MKISQLVPLSEYQQRKRKTKGNTRAKGNNVTPANTTVPQGNQYAVPGTATTPNVVGGVPNANQKFPYQPTDATQNGGAYTQNPNKPETGAMGRMASNLNPDRNQPSSTGGVTTTTPTGLVHQANPNNPNVAKSAEQPQTQPATNTQTPPATNTQPAQANNPQQLQATPAEEPNANTGSAWDKAKQIGRGVAGAATGVIKGVGDVASQAAGGVTQTIGAAAGGLKHGWDVSKAGDKFGRAYDNMLAQSGTGPGGMRTPNAYQQGKSYSNGYTGGAGQAGGGAGQAGGADEIEQLKNDLRQIDLRLQRKGI